MTPSFIGVEKDKLHLLVKHSGTSRRTTTTKCQGKGLETVTIHYTHTYIINIAIKFTYECTKIQTVQLCPELWQTRTLHIMHTLPELPPAKKHALTSLPCIEIGRLWRVI